MALRKLGATATADVFRVKKPVAVEEGVLVQPAELLSVRSKSGSFPGHQEAAAIATAAAGGLFSPRPPLQLAAEEEGELLVVAAVAVSARLVQVAVLVLVVLVLVPGRRTLHRRRLPRSVLHPLWVLPPLLAAQRSAFRGRDQTELEKAQTGALRKRPISG